MNLVTHIPHPKNEVILLAVKNEALQYQPERVSVRFGRHSLQKLIRRSRSREV